MVNRERLISEFERLAGIDSPSFREGEISRYLVDRFRQMGASVTVDDAASACGSESGNLIAVFEARGKKSEPLMLSVHMDTVTPADGVEPVLNDGVFTSAGETVLGADDKAGMVEIIEAIEVVREQGFEHGPIEVVITVCEEVGLLGAKNLDFSKISSRRGLALDTAGTDLVIHRAPCANKLRFEIIGREAHAGISPEKGLSAIQVAARAIDRMPQGRLDEETTANIGLITGGQATNIVPRSVTVEGEVRSHDPAKLELQTEMMLVCFEEASRELTKMVDNEPVRAEVRAEVIADYPLMAVPRHAGIIRLVEDASRSLGRFLDVQVAGGGSDANIYNSHGIETVIMGTGMTDVHSVNESVRVDDMVRVSELLVEVIRQA